MLVPGRILIVDDKRGEIEELLSEFLEKGEHAIYSGINVNTEYFANIRLLIMDYLLFEYSEKDSLDAICRIINDASKKSKFFLIAIWSGKVTAENREKFKQNIVEKYEQDYQEKIPGILLLPVNKDELNYKGLIEKIIDEIPNHPDLSLIFEIEKIVNEAKDVVINRIYDIGNWSNLIKNLKVEYDIYSIRRQVLRLYLNFLKRNLVISDEFKKSVFKLTKISQEFNIIDFAKVYSSQYFSKLSNKEQIGTGDILYNEIMHKYFLIITPECDITNNKHTKTSLIEAVRIEHSELDDPAYITTLKNNVDPLKKIRRGKIIPAVIHGSGLKNNYYILNFVYDFENRKYYHLLFDFHKVKSLKKIKKIYELKNYKRLCRVESPLINDFVQKYSTHCSRFGTMKIPEQVSQKLSEVLTSNETTPN